ncbi:SUKH-4 family immunity protein [Streptomyces sp. NPDC092903]|uniref:SUKH-4 family immunity protein n=1 Tax=Streptomyces sp. NPDC092903 TaxID=3366017 RepID=UPI00381CDB64
MAGPTDRATLRFNVTPDQMNHWFTEVERHTPPGITHDLTRRFLAETGLPRTAALIRFEPGGPDTTWPELHHIGAYGDHGHVLLDPGTGHVYSYDTGIGGAQPDPMSVDVSALVRDAHLAEDLRNDREPRHTADELVELLAVTEPELPRTGSFWPTAYVMWQLRRAAVPGDGLAVRVTREMLDLVYEGEYWGFPDELLPDALVHGPTRRFLRETGVVDAWAYLEMSGHEERLPTLAEITARRIEEEEDEELPGPPPDAEHLIVLGYVLEDTDLVVDGRTGLVLMWNQYEAELTPCNTDLSTLAFTKWAVAHARAEGCRLGLGMDHVWETIIRDLLGGIDPVAWADPWGYWPNLLFDGVNGIALD